MNSWIIYILGILTGIGFIIAFSVYGIIIANKKLGINLTTMVINWWKTRRMLKQYGDITKSEREIPESIGQE